MDALSRYDPGASLLQPGGGGTIHAMSGGGDVTSMALNKYDYTQTLIPDASATGTSGGEIPPYKGGFFQEPVHIIGGTDNSISSIEPLVKSDAQDGITVEADVKSNTPDNSVQPAEANDDAVKDIVLFGTTLTLENPSKNNGSEFTKSQIDALELFGLDGPALTIKEKQDVLQALYDGKCNSDKPLGMMVNCEPVRRIVQSLALNLLSKIQASDKNENSNIKNEEQPDVRFDKMGDGSMNVCITFKGPSLSLLSKFKPFFEKKKKKSKSVTDAVQSNISTDQEAEIVPKESQEKASVSELPVIEEKSNSVSSTPVVNASVSQAPVPNSSGSAKEPDVSETPIVEDDSRNIFQTEPTNRISNTQASASESVSDSATETPPEKSNDISEQSVVEDGVNKEDEAETPPEESAVIPEQSVIEDEASKEDESGTIKITPELANPIKSKLGQLKKKFSNSTRATNNKTKTNRYQRQAKSVNNNMKRLTPGKNITDKNIKNIESRLANSYNSVKGGKRKTFKKPAALKKRKTMKKQKK